VSHYQATREVTKNGYATTLAGRKRFFDLASTDKAQRATAERAAKNHPIQGTNADILKRALALLYTALPQRVHLLLCVHDEIVLECPEDLLAEAERILKEAMVQACRDYLKVVAIPEPEVVVGRAWIKK
jgi:DNA polymerase-1